MDVLVFSRAYDSYKQMLKADEMLIFVGKGRKDERSGGMSFVCDEVLTIEQMRVRKGATLMLELTEGRGLKTLVEVLQAGQNNEIGGVSCEVSIRSNGVKAEMYLKNGYIPSDQLLNQLRNSDSVASAKFVY